MISLLQNVSLRWLAIFIQNVFFTCVYIHTFIYTRVYKKHLNRCLKKTLRFLKCITKILRDVYRKTSCRFSLSKTHDSAANKNRPKLRFQLAMSMWISTFAQTLDRSVFTSVNTIYWCLLCHFEKFSC